MTAVPAQTIAAEQLRAAIRNGERIDNNLIDRVSLNTGLLLQEVRDIYRNVKATTPAPAKMATSAEPPKLAVAESKPASLDQAIATVSELVDHPHAAIRRHANGALERLQKIAELVPEYEAQEKARQRLAKLEAEAAKLRAELGATTGRKRALPRGEFKCSFCLKVFDTNQGLALHRTRVHG